MKIISQQSANFNTAIEPNAQILCAVDLPFWMYEDFCRIQGAWGVPFNLLIREALEGFVSNNWDFATDSPRQQKWNMEKARKRKPGVLSGRRLKPNKRRNTL